MGNGLSSRKIRITIPNGAVTKLKTALVGEMMKNEITLQIVCKLQMVTVLVINQGQYKVPKMVLSSVRLVLSETGAVVLLTRTVRGSIVELPQI